MYRPETVVNYVSCNYVVVDELNSGLASRDKSAMREIMDTNLTKKTGRNV